MMARVTEDHLVRANRMIACGLDQEQVSQWLATHDADKAEVERLKADRDACIEFIKTELQWCDFRGEMLSDTASVQNAQKLAEFLDRHKAAEAAAKKNEASDKLA